MTRGFLPLLAFVIATGLASLGFATSGFRVITTEGARRLAVEHHPRAVPDVVLVDQDGKRFTFSTYRGKALLVEFIYTSCPTICGVLGDDFGHVLATLRQDGGTSGVDLLSISFDPARDGPPALRSYAGRFGASAPGWRIAVPATREGLRALLKSFGVVVIPDRFGGFTHDAAVYLLDGQGRLVRILDAGPPATLLAEAAHAVS